MSAKRPLGPNLCRLVKNNKSAIHGHLLSRYDQVPLWIFSLEMCSSPISTSDICSLCEVVRAFLHQRDYNNCYKCCNGYCRSSLKYETDVYFHEAQKLICLAFTLCFQGTSWKCTILSKPLILVTFYNGVHKSLERRKFIEINTDVVLPTCTYSNNIQNVMPLKAAKDYYSYMGLDIL